MIKSKPFCKHGKRKALIRERSFHRKKDMSPTRQRGIFLAGASGSILGEDPAMRTRLLQFFRSAISLLPTLVVLGTLAGLAVVGHFTEWKISEAAKLWQRGNSAAEPDSSKQDGSKSSTSENAGLRFVTAEALEKSGLKTAPVIKRPMSQSVVANGILDYDRTRMAHLSTRAPGTVWKVYRRVGAAGPQGRSSWLGRCR